MKKVFKFVNENKIYNGVMVAVILLSLVPLLYHKTNLYLRIIELVTVTIFIIDYLLRWFSSGSNAETDGGNILKYILKYPFTPMAIIDLLSILPSLTVINPAFKTLRLLRLLRAFRVFRAFRLFRYSKNVAIIVNVFKKHRQSLGAVGLLAGGYIFISALVMFQVEPETFPKFFDALYWSTVSLTTVGYGDIYASSDVGHLMTMISALMGIAIVALPAGIVTAGYMDEIKKEK